MEGGVSLVNNDLRYDGCHILGHAALAEFVLQALLQMIANVALAHCPAFREWEGSALAVFSSVAHAQVDLSNLRTIAVADNYFVAGADQTDQ